MKKFTLLLITAAMLSCGSREDDPVNTPPQFTVPASFVKTWQATHWSDPDANKYYHTTNASSYYVRINGDNTMEFQDRDGYVKVKLTGHSSDSFYGTVSGNINESGYFADFNLYNNNPANTNEIKIMKPGKTTFILYTNK